jgi:hypothetical protein
MKPSNTLGVLASLSASPVEDDLASFVRTVPSLLITRTSTIGNETVRILAKRKSMAMHPWVSLSYRLSYICAISFFFQMGNDGIRVWYLSSLTYSFFTVVFQRTLVGATLIILLHSRSCLLYLLLPSEPYVM